MKNVSGKICTLSKEIMIDVSSRVEGKINTKTKQFSNNPDETAQNWHATCTM